MRKKLICKSCLHSCSHFLLFIFYIYFFLLLGALGQVKWLNISVFFMAMTRENAIDQPHLGFTQPIINVFAYFVFFRSINQALKIRKLPFHHKHAKSNTSRTKKYAVFVHFDKVPCYINCLPVYFLLHISLKKKNYGDEFPRHMM